MNYIKIYRELICNAKTKNRVKSRNCYYEKHHIIPDFMFIKRERKGPPGHLSGNSNDVNNIVLLTAREHFISHVLLYKAFKRTRYEFQCGSAITVFFKGMYKYQNDDRISIYNSKKYEKHRLVGVKSISKLRRGKMPVKDAKTGKSIGSIPVNHPKVLSGEWVHITKGNKLTELQLKHDRFNQKGTKNNNYKNIPIEYFFDLLKKFIKENNLVDGSYFVSRLWISFIRPFVKKDFDKSISGVFFMNRFQTWENFINKFNTVYDYNILYIPYYRSKEFRSNVGKRFKRK